MNGDCEERPVKTAGGRLKCKRVTVLAAAAAAVMAAVFLGWLGWRNGFFLPRWVQWNSRDFETSGGAYRLILSRKQVSVAAGGETVWNSPSQVKVQDVLAGDIDGDGSDEMVLLCWKVGRYGSSRPFWAEDENRWSQHLFVYELEEDTVRPKWMSSYMGTDVASIQMEDVSPEARLQAGPASCRALLLTAPDGQVSRWRWDYWGFTREDIDGE